MSVATLLLARLKRTRIEAYEDLRGLARDSVSGGDVLFLPALNILFILGLIEYRAKTDVVEYAGHEAL